MSNNFLIIMADEHNKKICGAYGNGVVQTPNLDALAARGTLFANAYTPCPICVPARATFATGLPVHRTRHWDNSCSYAGQPLSWAHVLSSPLSMYHCDVRFPVPVVACLEPDADGYDCIV